MGEFGAEDRARLGLLVIVLALMAAYGVGYWIAYFVWVVL